MNPSRFLFGQDIFISYSRADATAYAASLANALAARGFACFLDQWGTEPGAEIPAQVLSTLRRSSMLVLIGSVRASHSVAVEREVAAYLATPRPIVPISVDGALEQSSWFWRIAGASLSVESGERLIQGRPSEGVLTRIDSSFQFTKRNARVRRGFLAAGLGLLLLIGIAGWRQYAASVATRVATQAQADARQARDEATRRAREAGEQAALAKANAEEAKRQEATAMANASRAQQQQQIAEERTRRARSVELAAAARSTAETEPDTSALLAVASYRTAPTFEARQALLSSLANRPGLERVLIGPEEGHELAKGGSDSARITDAWFSADGRKIAAREWDGSISVWQSEAPRTRHSVFADRNVRFDAISRDFSFIVGRRYEDQTVHIRGLASSARDIVVAHPYGQVDEIEVSPDSSIIATGSNDGTVALWDSRSGKPVGGPLTQSNREQAEGSVAISYPVTMLRFGPGDKSLNWRTSKGDKGAANVATQQTIGALPEELPARFAFAADGADVAYVANDGSLEAARIINGKLLDKRKLVERDSMNAVAINADGTRIAGGNREGLLYIFDDEAPRTVVKAHSAPISALAFSPDGTRLISGSDDRTLLLWRMRRGPIYQTVETAQQWQGMIWSGAVRFTHDGKRLLATGSGSILVVDVTRGELEGAPIECEAGIGSLALQRDNRMIVAGSTRGKLYSVDLATHSCRELERSQIVSGNVGLVTALAFSPNGEFLASGDSEGALATWTLGGRLRANYLQDPNNSARAINSIAWTRDGSALVVGGIAHKRLWPLGSGKVTNLQSEADYSRVTAMSRDGHLIAGSSLEGVQLWDVSSGRVLMRFMIDRPADKVDDDTVTALAFSGNGQLLAVGQEDGWISLFDLGEHRWLGDLPTSGRCSSSACAVWSLDFSPDSSRLAAFVARKLLLWQLDAENWVRHACELANREFSASEVQRYLRADSPPGEICGVRTARVVNPPGPETRR